MESNNLLKLCKPIELLSLQRWLNYAVLINIFILSIEWVREDQHAALYTVLGIFLLIAMRVFLPNRKSLLRPWLCLTLSVIIIAIGFKLLTLSTLTVYNFWSKAWLIIPSMITFIWMLNGHVLNWNADSILPKDAGKSFARNKRLSPTYEAFGTHTFLLHVIAFIVLPLVWIIDVAISPGNALGGAIGDSLTFEHFNYIFSSDSFWLWAKNSIIVSCGTTLVGLSLAIPAGYAFSRYDFRGRKESMTLFMVIQMFPGAIILVPYFMVMKTLGLLNTSIGLIIVYSVSALPICVWMLKGYFDTIPRELEEAAQLDGCNQFQIFYRIILPLSITAISITALISFLGAWNEFLLALVFNTSNEMFTLPVGLASMIPSTGQRWGDFAAASIIVSIPIVALFVFFQKSLIEGLSAGAVKG